uniref:Uncharacterized protein n=1 Tax=Kwoniella bestiolae CBS 10118 TaxID=1296100 RepID=A0A1B9G5E5_9TREE|nr:hypothetical protein I302_03910 [Kwoniella bestiolae CBS 10118]OCF26231.1 hypothetical protein I302_03910 [Kwoniella bestiolae CBS 10118]
MSPSKTDSFTFSSIHDPIRDFQSDGSLMPTRGPSYYNRKPSVSYNMGNTMVHVHKVPKTITITIPEPPSRFGRRSSYAGKTTYHAGKHHFIIKYKLPSTRSVGVRETIPFREFLSEQVPHSSKYCMPEFTKWPFKFHICDPKISLNVSDAQMSCEKCGTVQDVPAEITIQVDDLESEYSLERYIRSQLWDCENCPEKSRMSLVEVSDDAAI